MKHIWTIIFYIIFLSHLIFAQGADRSYKITRTEQAPKIDGILDDDCWNNVEIQTNFTQFYPINGNNPSQRTFFQVIYDNSAIYVGAFLEDLNVDSLSCSLGRRDSDTEAGADLYAIYISPYNDDINGVCFMISASGVQTDILLSSQGDDHTWNSVWYSETKITENGWYAELKIPYSAIRFPENNVQEWGFNNMRFIHRYQEWSTWCHISIEHENWWNHSGTLKNIKNIDPPLRLSLTPYISGYIENNEENKWSNFYNGGLDLKYGINNSFTLDMTLIPDFGQVQSDNKVLNLSPFEIHYNENRQFFTEGMELFSKGDIFYSRRIGGKPLRANNIENNLEENEVISNNPNKTGLINATKISGRNSNGLGIGVFNAMTEKTSATIIDTLTGNKYKKTTQNFTNYNMFVLDKNLWPKSSVSFANTNMTTKKYIANVSATEFQIGDKNFNYGIRGQFAMSSVTDSDSNGTGYKYKLQLGKLNGKWQYSYEYGLETNTYDQNDMGFMRRNNQIEHEINFTHNIYNPFSIFISMSNELDIEYNELYKPRKYMSLRLDYMFHATFKNYYSFRMHSAWMPEEDDYYESRADNRVLKIPSLLHTCARLESDSRKDLIISIFGGYSRNKASYVDRILYIYNFNPTYRINDKFSIGYDIMGMSVRNDRGFVDNGTNGEIYFGLRNLSETTNILNINYVFTNKASLGFRLRHYWSTAEYLSYHTLNKKGYLDPAPNYKEDHEKNYNAFNIDMNFTWNFAPGSEMSIVWKNSISGSSNKIMTNYWNNFNNTIESPQINSLSIMILYYLDYQMFRNLYPA